MSDYFQDSCKSLAGAERTRTVEKARAGCSIFREGGRGRRGGERKVAGSPVKDPSLIAARRLFERKAEVSPPVIGHMVVNPLHTCARARARRSSETLRHRRSSPPIALLVRIILLLVYAKPLHLRKYVNSPSTGEGGYMSVLNDNNGIFMTGSGTSVCARYRLNICMNCP